MGMFKVTLGTRYPKWIYFYFFQVIANECYYSTVLYWCIVNVYFTYISMAQCKTVVTPLLTHWSYCSLALSHRYTPYRVGRLNMSDTCHNCRWRNRIRCATWCAKCTVNCGNMAAAEYKRNRVPEGQKQVLGAETSNYVPQYQWDVIICPCAWYPLLANKSSCNIHGTWPTCSTYYVVVGSIQKCLI